MAFTVEELVGRSRVKTIDGSEETRQYILISNNGTDTAATALAALESFANGQVGDTGLPGNQIRLTQEIRNHPTVAYFGEANFASAPASFPTAPTPAINAAAFLFNAVAPSGHVKTAYPGTTQTVYKATGVNHDPGNFLNVVRESGVWRVEGVDLAPPSPTFTLEYHPANATVSGAFSKDLLGYVGSVNSATFSIQGAAYGAEELLLTNVSGQKRTAEAWQISLGFAYQPSVNVTFTGINGGSPITKTGHRYMWTMDRSKVNIGANGLDFKADLVAVAEVWPKKSWAAAIGGLSQGLTTIASVTA